MWAFPFKRRGTGGAHLCLGQEADWRNHVANPEFVERCTEQAELQPEELEVVCDLGRLALQITVTGTSSDKP